MSTTTVRLKASQIYKDWHVIDAAGRPLGRVATQAASLLKGKHKPTFEPHLDDGDFVIIVNAAKITLSGNKEQQMRYYRHSGYPGGLRTRTFTEQMDRSPEKVLESAIWGMLPKGPLGKQMVKHLKVYRGPTHPHQSQVVGSERARSAREEALSATLTEPRKVARLRPLAGVVVAEVVEPPAKKAAPKQAAARRRTPAKTAPAAEAVAEAPAVQEMPVEAPVAEAPAEAKPTRARGRGAAAAGAATPEEAKPATRRRTAAKAEAPAATEASTETKPRRTRATKTDETAAATEEAPKPRRTRARKTESEGEES
jgi:large subunit ribosomal protein L13